MNRSNWNKQQTRKFNSAIERQEDRDGRDAKAQVAILDARLGTGVGAVKERAKLQSQIESEKE